MELPDTIENTDGEIFRVYKGVDWMINCGYVGEPDSAQQIHDDWEALVVGSAWAVRPAAPKPRRYHPSLMAHRP